MSSQINILICTEDRDNLSILSKIIEKTGPKCIQRSVTRGDAVSQFKLIPFEIFILDCSTIDRAELSSLINQVTSLHPSVSIILLIPENRQDIRAFAVDRDILFYLDTPVNENETCFVLDRLFHKLSYLANNEKNAAPPGKTVIPGFIGTCEVMQHLFDLIARIADDEFSTVLIRGESGTGKELVARAIHANSGRRKNNFVPVNCAAIPDDLLESELFGHMKGSFTGATQSKQGRIQYADGGTLFLDEIGDMKPSLQAKLLRVLQEKEFEPVGSLKPVPVNTRILAATHCNLEELVNDGRFREDLYYRLSVIPLTVPPLRERKKDIPALLESFITKYTSKRGREPISFAPQTMSVLNEYEWRGNIRELENLVQHMSILYSGTTIYPDNLPEKYTVSFDVHAQAASTASNPVKQSSMINSTTERAELLAPLRPDTPEIDFSSGPVNFNELVNDFERELILGAMKRTAGNKKEAARLLNLKRTTLLEKIKKKELTGLWER